MPVDGPIITVSAVVLSKVDLYRELLGKVLDKFEGGRISINWLERNSTSSLKIKQMRRFFGSRYRIRCRSVVAYSYCCRGSGGNYSFYVPR
ncbi:hypothetical protein J1N35_035385 [Gossypium stocksii]|uniref:Uncharacterized protein n=1 Tax=Gossypium stocksii TaxID=47602 RepID=A0A9D3UUB8_9ROSI|nr:hypothetical protein J1N35_035385 [Gossypium stocksii]